MTLQRFTIKFCSWHSISTHCHNKYACRHKNNTTVACCSSILTYLYLYMPATKYTDNLHGRISLWRLHLVGNARTIQGHSHWSGIYPDHGLYPQAIPECCIPTSIIQTSKAKNALRGSEVKRLRSQWGQLQSCNGINYHNRLVCMHALHYYQRDSIFNIIWEYI